MENRGQWGSRVGFILAAVGSAIGLGNIWRFPYVAASNGGGAFLIPYLVALLTAGIPLLILEFGLGHKYRTAAPGIFSKLNKKWEWIGWWQCAVGFVIATYYVVIIAWSISYVGHSFGLNWGADTKAFFFNDYLHISDGPFSFGKLNMSVFLPLIAVWAIIYVVLSGGVKGGIEKANKIFMPLLIVLILVITFRGVSLEGAIDGLNYFLTPDFSQITNGRVWVAAYGQLFYSLSIAFAIMLTYSSYLPKKSDIVNNAFITAFGNCGFSLIAGIAVFSVLGHMAHVQGVGVEEVAGAGVGLAFVVFPMAINALPSMGSIFGAVFFASLVFAGLSSSMSIVETYTAALRDKFHISRQKALNWACGISFLVSIVFATGAGLYILDIVDHFINNYGVAVLGLVEAILLGWFFNLESMREYVNPISDYHVGKWWNFCIKYITPVLLGIMTILNVIEDITNPYEGYPVASLIAYGVSAVLFVMVAGFIASKFKKDNDYLISPNKEVEL